MRARLKAAGGAVPNIPSWAGLTRGRFLILTGMDARLYWLLMRLLPRFSRILIDWIMPLWPVESLR